MASIKDVARAAGVSIASVSYALNGSPKVGDETRARILRIAGELNFKPNGMAKNLRRKKTRLIGIFSDGLSSGYFNDFTQGVQDALWPLGYGLVVANITPHMSLQGFRLLEERWVDGGIILSPYVLPLEELEKVSASIPLVLVDSRPPGSGSLTPGGDPELLLAGAPPIPPLDTAMQTVAVPKLGAASGSDAAGLDGSSGSSDPDPVGTLVRLARLVLDNREPATRISELLCDGGHRRIGFMGGPASSWDTRERYAAFVQVMASRGLPLEPDLVLEGRYWRQGARQAMESFLDGGKSADAWFCANDEMAMGTIQALEARGLRVPQDVAVAGFDDIEYAALVKPSLTTVSYDRYGMGRRALELLVDMMEGRPVPAWTPVPARVVRRESA